MASPLFEILEKKVLERTLEPAFPIGSFSGPPFIAKECTKLSLSRDEVYVVVAYKPRLTTAKKKERRRETVSLKLFTVTSESKRLISGESVIIERDAISPPSPFVETYQKTELLMGALAFAKANPREEYENAFFRLDLKDPVFAGLLA